ICSLSLLDALPIYEYVQDLDLDLTEALNASSRTGDYSAYILPSGSDLSALPNQDPKNPVTLEKVELGRMLFFETGIGLDAKNSVSLQTYSCGRRHGRERGCTAGRVRGIGDGAGGAGRCGDGRHKNPACTGDQVDAQGARPLPVIHTTFVTNALWAGTFGSFDVNEGTEDAWSQDTLVEDRKSVV